MKKCTDADSPTACGVVFGVSNATPGSVYGGNSVAITSMFDSAASSLTLNLASAVAAPGQSTLCNDLRIQISDNEVPARVLYDGPVMSMPAVALRTRSGNSTWFANDDNTFYFAMLLPSSSPNSDMGSSCSVTYRWTQNSF